MQLKELIQFVDGLKKNTFSNEVKTAWVNEVEGMVQTDVLRLAIQDVVQYAYREDADPELIVKPPHDRLYRYYLEAMICYEQEEYDRYENCMQMFNQNLNDFVRWVSETLRPQDELACFRGYYLSAYAIAVKLGFVGTEEEWIASLKGDKGDPFTYEDFTTQQLEDLTEGIQDYATAQAVQAAQQQVQQTAEAAADLVRQEVAEDAAAAKAASEEAQNARNIVEAAKETVLEATSGLDEEVQRVKDAATAAQESSQVAKESAVAAQTAATTAQTGATTAQQAAQTAQNAQQAAQSSAKTAQAASDAAANAKNAIANMTVNAVTLPEGSEATVTKTEQGGGFNLQYGIPRGDTGQQGAQGARGPEGATGPAGAVGPTGPGGPQGVQGERGPEGATGPAGPQGPAGPAGQQGEQGERGPEGPAGPQGPEGPRGIDGVAVATDGAYAFNVDEDGNLVLYYTGQTAPDFEILEDGMLVLNV